MLPYHTTSTFENDYNRLVPASTFDMSGELHNFLTPITRRQRIGSPTTPVVGPGLAGRLPGESYGSGEFSDR